MFLILFIVLVVLRLVGKIKSWWSVFGIMFLVFLFFCVGAVLGAHAMKETPIHTVIT